MPSSSDNGYSLEELGTNPVPTFPCVDPGYFLAEKEKIFKRVWLNLCHETDLPNPGDFLVKSAPTLGIEVLLTRLEGGELRAFYNICTHRNNKVIRSPKSGNARTFSCGFHGWVFNSQGELIQVPDEDEFVNFKKCSFGLRPLAIDTWENFVFVHPEEAPEVSLQDWLGEISVDVSGGPLKKLRPTAKFHAIVEVNWKVFSDAFCEAYHVGTLHKRSVAGSFISRENPFCHHGGTRIYENHSILSVLGGNPDHQPTNAEKLVGEFGGGSYGKGLNGAFDHLPPGLNRARHDSWNFDIVNIFPNFAVHIGADFAYTYNFWPISATKTVWDVSIYQEPAKNLSEEVAQNYMRVLLRDTLREDVNTTEASQQNMNSGVVGTMPLSKQEIVLRHRYKVVERWLK